MKIAVLWTALSGYLNACLKELSKRGSVELFVSHKVAEANAPFDDAQFAWLPKRLGWRSEDDLKQLDSLLRDFEPDIMVIASWHIPTYRHAARAHADRCWRVMVMDNPWLGTLKQRAGTLISPFFVKPIADAVWLPGERQATFARKLGFSQSAIMRGSFSCDQPAFEVMHASRIEQGESLPHRFAFLGRMVADKGIDELAEAYASYRELSPDPWPLVCCGSGPLRSRLENQPGIRVDGFVQPENIPGVLASAACLILPSRFEPWALVVHEAASAGRLILASENVGAVTHLVQPGYNGFVFNSNDAAGLTTLMLRVSAMTDVQLDQMSQASHSLSKQYSPRLWSNILLESYNARSAKQM